MDGAAWMLLALTVLALVSICVEISLPNRP